MSFHSRPEPTSGDPLFDWNETEVTEDDDLEDEIDLSELLDRERPGEEGAF